MFALLVNAGVGSALAYSNGGISSTVASPKYSTHDFIVDHALSFLPAEEKQYLVDRFSRLLFGTELPDYASAVGGYGIGDTSKHHVYYFSNKTLQDNSSAVRAQDMYNYSLQLMMEGDLDKAVMMIGAMTHYITDVGSFGHVMGASTDWGAPDLAMVTEFEDYVGNRTMQYVSNTFGKYIIFDGELTARTAYNATLELAYNTTFGDSKGRSAAWLNGFWCGCSSLCRERAGQTLNIAINLVADVLHTFYLEASGEGGIAAITSATVTNGSGVADLVGGGMARVYTGSQLWMNFTVANVNFSSPVPLRIRLYDNGTLTGESVEVMVSQGSPSLQPFLISSIQGPAIHYYSAELVLNTTFGEVVKDVVNFSVKAVNNSIGVSAAPLSIGGGNQTKSWQITVSNTGNDALNGVTLRVKSVQDGTITPLNATVGTINEGGSKAVFLNLTTSPGSSIGVKQVIIEARYKDFTGAERAQDFVVNYNVTRVLTEIDLSISQAGVKVNDSVFVTALLKDSNLVPLVNKAIRFYSNATYLGMMTTDMNGSATILVPTEAVGTFELRAEFSGDSVYEGAQRAITIQVLPIETSVSVLINGTQQAGGFEMKVNDSVFVTALLKDSNLVPLVNKAIRFYSNATYLGMMTTDMNGSATILVPTEAVGTFELRAEFSGDSVYEGAQRAITIQVLPIETSVSMQTEGAAITGKPLLLKAYVKDENNASVAGITVWFQEKSGSSWVTLGSAVSDNSGVATFSYQQVKAGEAVFRAVFAGESVYDGSSSAELSIVGRDDPTTTYAIIIVAILAAAAVFYFVFVRRR
ncbi:MAG: hypothetical protein NO516_01350 [Candidatus Methanomethylicia archaeon]|nr:hypothetical protein [Candidatus Methanomethylicia archaeon]